MSPERCDLIFVVVVYFFGLEETAAGFVEGDGAVVGGSEEAAGLEAGESGEGPMQHFDRQGYRSKRLNNIGQILISNILITF